ncbi:3-deoxy-D-manno-octulosonic acid kinase [Shewanella sp. NIFS-20-20]|uniref:3-deoxy-D-manno-octulosonic acid kinase n=1 Tax=Shewanella sp. NIFS-20-20 TaxID=2853806 RepID=UPI001C455DE3|nr:3-deoxy-D-manno-octulosonic acid kinase [Shewanella sp. NIFS-20-20]MBV7316119.1 3-deoxy-D-manno-octulosonic acid kinase [Shewanella sp. NIFS-20-20]
MSFTLKIQKLDQTSLLSTQFAPQQLSPDWFEPDYWQSRDAVIGSSCGRYTTWFVEQDRQQWVLRHYWRGGAIARLSKDKYCYLGLQRTRAAAELTLLNTLWIEGYPVPKPIAARVIRHGLFYQADILIEKIAGARDLVDILSEQSFDMEQWQALGGCIAKFHQRGVYHADLNAKNIMLNEDGFHLIDFDRGAIKPASHQWQQANLARLLRSFTKEKSKQPHLAFSDDCWMSLLKGYNLTRALG